MTLIEQIYDELAEQQLVHTQWEFSEDWCNRSKDWFAHLRHRNREIGLLAQIDLLKTIQSKKQIYTAWRQRDGRRMGWIIEEPLASLAKTENQILISLHQRFGFQALPHQPLHTLC